MLEVLRDAIIDSLKILPFLFLVYVFIEVIEHAVTPKLSARLFAGKLAPLIGTAAGILPQCGFSVIATNLYAKQHIALGTLLAVFISTSDEALPIMLSNTAALPKILPLMGIKIILALVVGYSVNFFVRKKVLDKTAENIGTTGCHHHKISGDKNEKFDAKTYILHPLKHTATVFAFILVVNIIFGALIYGVGEQTLTDFLTDVKYFQPLIAALIGLIPNCASSVIITQAYVLGQISMGAAVAGLSVNAGLGFAMLFKQNKNLKENVFILVFLFVLSVLVGTGIMLITP